MTIEEEIRLEKQLAELKAVALEYAADIIKEMEVGIKPEDLYDFIKDKGAGMKPKDLYDTVKDMGAEK